MKVNWNDVDNIQRVIIDSKNKTEVLRKLGYNYSSSFARRKLNDIIYTHSLNVDSFNTRTDRWNVLPDIISECYSIADVCRAVGLNDNGNNHQTAKKYIEQLNLNTDHFSRIETTIKTQNTKYRTVYRRQQSEQIHGQIKN